MAKHTAPYSCNLSGVLSCDPVESRTNKGKPQHTLSLVDRASVYCTLSQLLYCDVGELEVLTNRSEVYLFNVSVQKSRESASGGKISASMWLIDDGYVLKTGQVSSVPAARAELLIY